MGLLATNEEARHAASADAAKVQAALQLIEQSQNAIEQAARLLSGVDGYARPWARVVHLHSKVKGEWHILDGFRQSCALKAGR